MWDEITYPFPNLNGCTVEAWEWITNSIQHFINGRNYLSMLGLKLIHVSKRDPRSSWFFNQCFSQILSWNVDGLSKYTTSAPGKPNQCFSITKLKISGVWKVILIFAAYLNTLKSYFNAIVPGLIRITSTLIRSWGIPHPWPSLEYSKCGGLSIPLHTRLSYKRRDD